MMYKRPLGIFTSKLNRSQMHDAARTEKKAIHACTDRARPLTAISNNEKMETKIKIFSHFFRCVVSILF